MAVLKWAANQSGRPTRKGWRAGKVRGMAVTSREPSDLEPGGRKLSRLIAFNGVVWLCR